MNEKDYSILISLMDSHPLPKLLVFKQLKPDLAVVFHTDTEAVDEYRRDFIGWLKRRSVPCHSVRIDETDIDGMVRILNDFVMKAPSRNIILDVTGVPPSMTMAAAKVSQIFNLSMVSLDDDTNTLMYMNSSEKTPLSVRLTVRDCFEVSGGEIVSELAGMNALDEIQVELSFYAGKHYRELKPFILFLNSAVRESRRRRPFVFSRKEKLPHQVIQYAKFLDENNYIHILHGTDREIRFKLTRDHTRRKFVSGVWLEGYVLQMAKNCNPDDIQTGVTVKWDKDDSKSSTFEIDVAFVKNDRLILVECKSGAHILRNEGELNYHLMRLATIRRYFGGLYAEAILVLAGHLPDSYRSAQRAREFDIPVFDYDELERLDIYFDRFKPGGRTI